MEGVSWADLERDLGCATRGWSRSARSLPSPQARRAQRATPVAATRARWCHDDAGTVVGLRMWGCGDPGWGVVTSNSRAYNGCIM
ncbi:DUF6289 family protein [Luteimonas notoginsengisoli]|uniref:DUF6289 family protein n=1 Tax=Luteimonas notoginsengisoli TaxID=1578200 RepID=A0ABV7USX5_9GAMM